jgi:hypothetical protein
VRNLLVQSLMVQRSVLAEEQSDMMVKGKLVSSNPKPMMKDRRRVVLYTNSTSIDDAA